MSKRERTIYDLYVKRAFDIGASVSALVILSPLYLASAAAIMIEDGRPVIFRQERIGIDKSRFIMHKFRSMKKGTPVDVPTHLAKGHIAKNTTRTGSFIRKYSIDEIPQFYDILTGKMSLIGPRCALWNQDDLIKERDKYGANDIRPGLTGWAQINGRDDLEIHEKAMLDGEYTRRLKDSSAKGFMMDLKCLAGTIVAVIKANGVAE